MKVLIVGDACVSTGFARCTHAAADALHAAGHEVDILGINYYGDPHDRPYRVWPCRQPWDKGLDAFGVSRLPVLMNRLRPDIVMVLQDPWNIAPYFEQMDAMLPEDFHLPPVVGWIAVDAKNIDGNGLNHLTHVIAWTEFGAHEISAGGYVGPTTVIPLGVDHEVFKPHLKEEARAHLFAQVPEAQRPTADSYVIGVVGRNQPRKRLDITLEYFSYWIRSKNITDAYLYLHVAPTGEMGCNLNKVAKYYGLTGRVVVTQPHAGHGFHESVLPLVYSALDVYWSTSQGEGWGLPALEAMACGVPCVLPDYAAFSDWPKDAALRVPVSSFAVNAPWGDGPYTMGGIPDRAKNTYALDLLYKNPDHRRYYREAGLELAAQFSWARTGAEVLAVLEEVYARTAGREQRTANG